ncbi:basic blue protein-like [Panicum miliaceum]|uniref:Basic blue protein-like n=1 Tax=Panicum miliaceum TaxID=4540 RepID=A0A3L6Q6T1_PANMI|nr:basic blue protein-like [Panicum miliaceum]
MVAAESRLWPVGDSHGWTFGVLGWPNYKPIKAGDVLWFKYPRGVHNVVQVHEPGHYSTCDIPDNATIWTSGDNRITIPRGMSFICGIRDHCKNGLKIAVTAS